MPNKNSNVTYDQLPHIVINHPETNPEHKEIMRALYKVLKDYPQIIYSNEKLSTNTRIPLRTIERRIKELCDFGFIVRQGKGHNRKLSLGILFNNTATLAVKNLNNTATLAENSAKSGVVLRHTGGHYKNYTKNQTKEEKFSFSPNPLYQEYFTLISSGIKLGVIPKETNILSYTEWLQIHNEDVSIMK